MGVDAPGVPVVPPLIEACELSKSYSARNGIVRALDGFSTRLFPGEILGLLGKNGAGKSTAVRALTGLLTPDRGSVNIGTGGARRQAPTIGVTLEGARNLYWRLTPKENIEYFGALRGLSSRRAREAARRLLAQFELEGKADHPVQKLSRGMQQRVAIAAAMVHSPQILVLDEPTLGVDFEGTMILKRAILALRDEGRGIVLCTHQIDVAEELCDRIVIVKDGKVVAQAVTEELVRHFAADAYEIQVEGTLSEAQIVDLNAQGAQVEHNRIRFRGEPSHMYTILQTLSPLPLTRLTRQDVGLQFAFEKYSS